MGKARFSFWLKMPAEWPEYVRKDFESPVLEIEREFQHRSQMVAYANDLSKNTRLGSWKVNWTEADVDVNTLII